MKALADSFSRRDSVIMRGWEAVLYRAYDGLLQAFVDAFTWPRQYIVKAREAVMRQFEYYLDDRGEIRIRRNTGRQGVYQMIEGKMVKVSDGVSAILSIIPWKECNAGYYDAELGTHIESKKQYRQMMKKEGLVPLEANRYGGSQSYRKEKLRKEERAKGRKGREKVFIEACRKYAPFGLNEEGL